MQQKYVGSIRLWMYVIYTAAFSGMMAVLVFWVLNQSPTNYVGYVKLYVMHDIGMADNLVNSILARTTISNQYM